MRSMLGPPHCRFRRRLAWMCLKNGKRLAIAIKTIACGRDLGVARSTGVKEARRWSRAAATSSTGT